MAELLNIGWGIAHIAHNNRQWLAIVNETDGTESPADLLLARKVCVPRRLEEEVTGEMKTIASGDRATSTPRVDGLLQQAK